MQERRIYLFEEAPVTRAILSMSLPVVMGMMVQVLYNLVDTFFIGMTGDPNLLAAAAIGLPVFMLLMAIAGIIGTGASSFISRCLGENRPDRANKTLTIGVVLCTILGGVVMTIGGVFARPLIGLLGATPLTAQPTYDYVFVLFLGSIPIMANYAVGMLLRAEGGAMFSMKGMLLGAVANIILDPIFIFTFDMGIQGAAIATVLGNCIGLGYYALCYSRKKTLLAVRWRDFSFDREICREIFAIGTPASLSQLLMSFAMVFNNNIALGYGEITVAGMDIAMKVMTIGTFIFMGFAAGCQPLTGYNYGARNAARVKEILKKGFLLTTTIGITLMAIFWIFASKIVGIFIQVPEVVAVGTTILRAFALSLPFVGGQMLGTTSVQAMGKAVPALFLSICRQGILYIPLLFLLNNTLGFQGFIYAQSITDVIIFVIVVYLLVRIFEKDTRMQPILEPEIQTSET